MRRKENVEREKRRFVERGRGECQERGKNVSFLREMGNGESRESWTENAKRLRGNEFASLEREKGVNRVSVWGVLTTRWIQTYGIRIQFIVRIQSIVESGLSKVRIQLKLRFEFSESEFNN